MCQPSSEALFRSHIIGEYEGNINYCCFLTSSIIKLPNIVLLSLYEMVNGTVIEHY